MLGTCLSNRYEIVAELGRGGMGIVYRARDPVLGRDVAVKLIPPSLLTPESEQRFQTEALIVAGMDHPSILPIHDLGRHEGAMFFVMPLARGKGLRALIDDASLLLRDLVEIGIQVAEALAYSHSQGVVHRDIKPDNILVSRIDGNVRVRVMDFGLARCRDVTRLTKTGTLVGTMSYMSPEQIGARNVDGRSDTYSLGTVLYECVANGLPFSGELQSVLYRIVHEIPQSPRERGAAISEELDAIIMSCLAKDPGARPQEVGAVALALKDYRETLKESQQLRSVIATGPIVIPKPALPPFVGREQEMKELQRRLNLAVDGACQLALVAGPPGAGKSRLLDELENLADARHVRVLHGRLVEQEAAFPYYGFCEAIQEYFRQVEAARSRDVPDLSDLAADLIALFPMLDAVPLIRKAAQGNPQSRGLTDAPSAESRIRIYELLARTLTRLASEEPLVLIFEELHSAESSIQALQYLIQRMASTPTLVIGSYRSTDIHRRHPVSRMIHALRGDRRYSQITLGAFSASVHRQYLQTLIGGDDVVDHLAEQLFEASEGNPFFTKELVRSLLDSGHIVQDRSGAWTLSGSAQISSDTLPATIQEAVEERISRLPDGLREFLSVASVLGRDFDFRDLELLVEDRVETDDAVDRLVQEGLVEEERQAPGDRLVFCSGVVRDALYSRLSRRRRRALHRRYARILEERNSGRLEDVYPPLVHHFAEGDVPDKAVRYGLLHARKSLETFSPEEASRAAKTALEFLDREWQGDRSLEGEARLELARAYDMLGDVNTAFKELENCVRIFEAQNATERVLEAQLVAARSAWQARKTVETARWVQRGLKTARALGEPGRLVDFLSLAATLANLRGDYAQAADILREVEELSAATRDTQPATRVQPSGGTVVVALANPIEAESPPDFEFTEEVEVHGNRFETLLGTDQNGNVAARLCETWESGNDGKSFRFTLRPEVRFHDGHELTAEDVKSSLEHSFRRGDRSRLPPAVLAIRGAGAFVAGESQAIEGIVTKGTLEFEILLEDPLPIYPSLLTDPRTGIFRTDGDRYLGTGPFRLRERDSRRIVLQSVSEHWSGKLPNLDEIEFRTGLSAKAVGTGMRSGTFDIGRDLLPEDLEAILRDPRFRGRLIERPGQFTHFVLFNTVGSPIASHATLREVLAHSVRPHDLVWQTLGRFAHPTPGFFPAGILGHDAGRRSRPLSLEDARGRLRAAHLPREIRLEATVHPLMLDRYGSLLQAMFAVWEELDVTVSVKAATMASFLETIENNQDIDLYIGRFAPDFADPDNYAHSLFRTGAGELSNFFCSPEADEIIDRARAESRPAMREKLYRAFESLLLDSGTLIPLFNDVDYRITNRSVTGLELLSSPPFLDYGTLARCDGATPETPGRRAVLNVPMSLQVHSLDPALTETQEQAEIFPSIYETLTRDAGEARIVPWLASRFEVTDSGRTYHFKLREDVHFHDGRRLTARDVRYSFERMLQNDGCEWRHSCSPIRGARSVIDGTAEGLEGFQIHSSHAFSIYLDEPVAFFPGLLSFPALSIVPEGTARIGNDWTQGAVGTGPFRVARFEPGLRLELDRNPGYWRSGSPHVQGLVFTFGVDSKEILSGFREGRFSLAADLFPSDVEELRREGSWVYRDTPGLSTYFIAFNVHRGPLIEPDLRRRIAAALDVNDIVNDTLRQLAIPARGLIPPALLGYESGRHGSVPRPAGGTAGKVGRRTSLRAAIHPVFAGQYASFLELLTDRMLEIEIELVPVTSTFREFVDAQHGNDADLYLGRWIADYPDADTFAHLLHSKQGLYGGVCGFPATDRLIETARDESDPHARHAIYDRIEEIIAREVHLLPLFHLQVYRFARPELDGLSVSYWNPAVGYDQLRLRT